MFDYPEINWDKTWGNVGGRVKMTNSGKCVFIFIPATGNQPQQAFIVGAKTLRAVVNGGYTSCKIHTVHTVEDTEKENKEEPENAKMQ